LSVRLNNFGSHRTEHACVLVIRRFAPHPCGAAYGVLSADASSQPLGHPSRTCTLSVRLNNFGSHRTEHARVLVIRRFAPHPCGAACGVLSA